MMLCQIIVAVLIGLVCHLSRPVLGHGRLWEPPSRSTMWRRGYSTPINYQDNELFCGGFQHQLKLGYKCGICGDPYDGIRRNEAGGIYATGLITRTYTQGQRVTWQVDLTANHKGFMEFKICPTNNPKVKATQECLDLHPVSLADGSGTQFPAGTQSKMFYIDLVLPADLSCDFCVVQWRYHAGNNWGTDPDGTSCIGCGPQEEFYGCADIKILPSGSQSRTTISPVTNAPITNAPVTTARVTNGRVTNAPITNAPITNAPITNAPVTQAPKTNAPVTQAPKTNAPVTQAPTTQAPGGPIPLGTNGDHMICRGIGGFALDNWCQLNCQVGSCPAALCACVVGQYPHKVARPSGCRGAGAYAYVTNYDNWCLVNCAVGYCPGSYCVC